MSKLIRQGAPVEYTEHYVCDYEGGGKLARFGILTKDTPIDADLFRVAIADGKIITVSGNCVQAIAWAGWLPEELEDIADKYDPHPWDNNEEG